MSDQDGQPAPETGQPSPNGADGGRDPVTGKFLPGNKGGPGSPHARTVSLLRAALFSAVTPEDMRDMVRAMVKKAREGDAFATRLVWEYTLGKVKQDFSVENGGRPLTITIGQAQAPKPEDEDEDQAEAQA